MAANARRVKSFFFNEVADGLTSSPRYGVRVAQFLPFQRIGNVKVLGGYAIVLGATDRRLRCVVAHVPTVSGYEQASRFADERVSAVLWNGVYGSAMPAWREYSERDLRDLVAFIKQQPRTYSDKPPLDAAARRQAQSLCLQHCASCHGEQGDGRGPAAGALAPAPTNFHLEQPTRARALNVLEHGVPGTAMPSWTDQLSDSDRLLLSGYISSLFGTLTTPGKEQPRD